MKHSADILVFILDFSFFGKLQKRLHITAAEIFPAVTDRKTIIPADVSG